ncbi:hypothetical protein AB1E18_006588 [Capra hircus]
MTCAPPPRALGPWVRTWWQSVGAEGSYCSAGRGQIFAAEGWASYSVASRRHRVSEAGKATRCDLFLFCRRGPSSPFPRRQMF